MMQAQERAAEFSAAGNQERHMVKPGSDRPRRPAGNAGTLLQDEQIPERHGRALIPAHVQAKHTPVEGQGTLEVSDSQAHTPDVGVGGKRGHQ